MKNKNRLNKGITLIALVVTIIILLILAGVAISIVSGSGLLGRTDETRFKTKMSQIAEEYQTYKAGLMMDAVKDGNEVAVVNAGRALVQIIQSDEYEIGVEEDSVEDIKEILNTVGNEEEGYVMIYNDELYYVQRTVEDERADWCEDIGIKVFEYFAEDLVGIKVANGSFENVNGICMCTPMVKAGGFNEYNTRYLKLNSSGKLVPGNWINKTPPDDWYDYSQQKWANLYVENGGIESYFVWIPRYVYKQDTANSTSGNERMDVKFVNLDNEYVDGTTGEVTSWATLQSQGYQLPEAFRFAETDLPGYWMSKYQLSEFNNNSTYKIYFETTSTPNKISVKNLTVGSDAIVSYTYAINGKIVHTSNNPDNYDFTGLASGDKAICVTGLDADGRIVGSFTYLFKVADVNAPDTSAFDPDTTFYVYYDDDGTEHNEIPIRENAPSNWYDYTSAYWANIVTRNNGLETYYVWIPRYEFQINSTTQRTYVNFIKGTGTQTTSGYAIPEAFTFNGVQLPGFWISKYQLSNEESTPRMTVEMAAGGTVIRLGNITGSRIAEGLKYEYYLSGVKKHEGEDPNEQYAYTGLTPNTYYTVNIIARNKETNAFVAATTRKLKTPYDANAPDVSKFDPSTTFYVSYNNGEEVRTPLTSTAPSDWYDYSDKRWANVVTTAGNTNTYWVWIPRYEFSVNSTTQRTNVNFINGTSTETTAGYAIPEAFTFNGVPLTGYWISKYQLHN